MTATERLTGLSCRVTIDNAIERFRTHQRIDVSTAWRRSSRRRKPPPKRRAASPTSNPAPDVEDDSLPFAQRAAFQTALAAIAKAERVLPEANAEDAAELQALLADLNAAIVRRSEDDVRKIAAEVEDLVFYLEDQ